MSIRGKFDDVMRDIEALIAQADMVESEKKSWEESNLTLKTRLQKLSEDEKKLKAEKEQLEQEKSFVKKQEEEYQLRLSLLEKEWNKYKEANKAYLLKEASLEMREKKVEGLEKMKQDIEEREKRLDREIDADRDRKNALNIREHAILIEKERLKRLQG